jgi:hypothetical protein
MTRRTLTLIGAPLALALLLAACGGSSGTTAPAGGSAEAPAAATRDPGPTDAGGGTSGGGADATAAVDAGAGGSDGTAAIPPCATLLSDAEAEAILGTKPKPVSDQSFPGSAYCSWDIGDGFALTVKASTDPTSVDMWRAEKDSVPTAVDGKEMAPPSGLGDESYAFDANADTYWVFVRRGDTTLRISAPASALPEQTVRDLVDKLYSRF